MIIISLAILDLIHTDLATLDLTLTDLAIPDLIHTELATVAVTTIKFSSMKGLMSFMKQGMTRKGLVI